MNKYIEDLNSLSVKNNADVLHGITIGLGYAQQIASDARLNLAGNESFQELLDYTARLHSKTPDK